MNHTNCYNCCKPLPEHHRSIFCSDNCEEMNEQYMAYLTNEGEHALRIDVEHDGGSLEAMRGFKLAARRL